jgi:hypothetical protein
VVVRTRVKRPPLMIFDVESIGLHGEAFAVGYVLIVDGEPEEEALFWCHPDYAAGPDAGHAWIAEHVLPKLPGPPTYETTREVRDRFWSTWQALRDTTQLMADVSWPVEANFLSACIRDDEDRRRWEGPYPLLDAGTLTFAGLTSAYEPHAPHNPLEDARATWTSIRAWWSGRES